MVKRAGGFWIALAIWGALPELGHAQAMSNAVLELARGSAVVGGVRTVDGRRLYGGVVCAQITNRDSVMDNLGGTDLVAFRVLSRAQVGGLANPCTAPGGLTFNTGTTGDQFEEWAQVNRDALFSILFPTGLSDALLGRGAPQVYAQQLLLTTVLGSDVTRRPGAAGRAGAGALVEFEWFDRADTTDSTSNAVQGLYDFNGSLSVQTRYARQNEDLSTHAITGAVDFHPFREFNRAVVWRVGGMARAGVTYASASFAATNAVSSVSSPSDPLRFASVDLGGGGWVSAFKDYGRARIGAGAILQGSENHVPSAWLPDGYDYVATALNDRSLAMDVTWGASVGYDVSDRVALLGKYVETDSLRSGIAPVPEASLIGLDLNTPASRMVVAGVARRVGALRFSGGYRRLWNGDLHAQAVFVRGNFDW